MIGPHLCEVCNVNEMVAVCCSAFGAMSSAYCLECHQRMAEPEFGFSYVWESTDGNVAEWVHQMSTWKDGRYWTWQEWVDWRMYQWFEPDPMLHWWAFKPHGPLDEPATPEWMTRPADFTEFDDDFPEQVAVAPSPS